MKRQQVKILDKNFQKGSNSSNPKIKAKYFDWDFWKIEDGYHFPDDVIFFTDTHIPTAPFFSCRLKVAWLIEPRALYEIAYDWLPKHLNEFDYVITYDRKLSQLDPKKILFLPHAGTLLAENEIGIPESKPKFCSMMVSKSYSHPGHIFRHEVHHEFLDLVDGFGLGSKTSPKFLENKSDALKPYKFHVVVENSIQDDYFAEVLIDPMLCGSIPIYWGTDRVREYFPKLSLTFRTLPELRNILERIKTIDYEEFEEERQSNFALAKEKYFHREDIFFEKFPFLFEQETGSQKTNKKWFPFTLRSHSEKKLTDLQEQNRRVREQSSKLRAENKRFRFERDWTAKELRQAREERNAAMRIADLEVCADKVISWEKRVCQAESEKLRQNNEEN